MIEAVCHVAVEGAGHLLRDVLQTLAETVLTPAGPSPVTQAKKTKTRTTKAAKGSKT